MTDRRGLKIEFPTEYETVWTTLSSDIKDMLPDEFEGGSTVDDCVRYVVDQCALRLGVQVDSDTVLAVVGHTVPHVLEPSLVAGYPGHKSYFNHSYHINQHQC